MVIGSMARQKHGWGGGRQKRQGVREGGHAEELQLSIERREVARRGTTCELVPSSHGVIPCPVRFTYKPQI